MSENKGRPIGYEIHHRWCLKCAPEGITETDPMREGDDYGIAYYCDECGEPLEPAKESADV